MTNETKKLIVDVLYKYCYYCQDTFTDKDQCCRFLFNDIVFLIFKADKDKIETLIESLYRLDDLME